MRKASPQGVSAMSRNPALHSPDSRGDGSAQLDVLRHELERERLRADRAVAYGARLLVRLEALEQTLREYGTHRADCLELDALQHGGDCSCGLRTELREAEAWRVFP
jgi:hypothetical protein